MSIPKDQEPQVGPFDCRDIPNQGMNSSWGIVERQLQDGELHRILDRLGAPPYLKRDSEVVPPSNISNPMSSGSDERPLPVARGTSDCINSNHSRSPILNPNSDSDSETQENTQMANKLADLAVLEQQMDAETRLLATRFFNIMLARLWRRRKAEVCDLNTLVRTYQEDAARTQAELFTRNQMIRFEQSRGQQLSTRLARAINRVRVTMENCAELEKELKELRKRETTLHSDLASKSLECEYFSEMLDTYRTEMFREMTNYREGAKELANQQRRSLELERKNAQLEDELLTIKDYFMLQNDKMSVALGKKQEQLDTAYESLKLCEEELAKLEMKYNEQVRQSQIDMALQNELLDLKKNLGMARYLIFYLKACGWGTFQGCVYHMVAGSLDCLAPAFSSPPMADNLLRIAISTIFLLFAMY
ncbi:uncharacterized protein LOC108137131 isoform X2 [Drosophila elegans]|uniref:uncharacterized protein LOC108137131 isoform X2 n=1 Tax=Drosophila elegans TaxID=30023 RepID=UPI0007E7B13E|nr:uncharacterized protein LOC108137131 isoform X2 [Drosophila elegans]